MFAALLGQVRYVGGKGVVCWTSIHLSGRQLSFLLFVFCLHASCCVLQPSGMYVSPHSLYLQLRDFLIPLNWPCSPLLSLPRQVLLTVQS